MDTVEPLVSISDPGEVDRASHNKGDRAIITTANLFAWLFPILMIAICAQVVLRSSGFNQAWLDDLQWWLYGAAVLVGIGYAVTTDSHVRVDIFYDNFDEAKQTKINIFGLSWLFLPFIILCWDVTVHYAISSVGAWEGSDSPNGLHNLWILKIFMNVSFLFVAVACWFAYTRNLAKLTELTLFKKLFWAFPSVMYLVNLATYYALWWFVYVTTPDLTNARQVTRHWLFDEVEFGAQDIKITIIITLVLTLLLLAVTYVTSNRGASKTSEG
ncbi:TRAP-type mannitol/chloroaromatic compound transport system permease small subunit [Litoreibacter ponti]|uniref:TRAP transporter small permease protein n=1 Tax=Litoreibacter ponti TaxID=1510457 RepID=A0A2T6BFD8_9RHOB|nr:TRAP transporter small permease subunit [Litoreibacter ponti]PTX54776.1 TRAP-type mannitol/chloroaromatic compound transport system permease small subunit [Litoreibacter ponti]